MPEVPPLRILVVESALSEAGEVREGLERMGLGVHWADSGAEALALCGSEPFDAAVLDAALPDMSGVVWVRRLRESGDPLPVIFLSAQADLDDRLRGLEAGADDYLARPCGLPEIAARVRAVARRGRGRAPQGLVHLADLVWDARRRHISRAGRRIDLTLKEYALLALLLEHVGRVVSRQEVAEVVWGAQVVDGNAIDVQIARLRRKVDHAHPVKLIHTRRGIGLVLEVHPAFA
ncbi:response regulator transcription factor [Geothrix sp. 21YS21S-4]|uniref:response regulator transcription factor n=1 Tax=Geothrix sp. 21YS21S-4 TaxID=3068889 RepID=UPI0027B97D10|nr:response regulator transcription factor [Geothrix sp. 21YS21S-4]